MPLALDAFLDELDKLAASSSAWRLPKSRAGRRPLTVDTLLKKDKEGTLFKDTTFLGASATKQGSAVRYQAFLDELEKISAPLTPAGRDRVKDKNFALSARQSDTGKPAYPIHDEAHARNAVARVQQHGSPEEKSEVFKDIARKYPGLVTRSEVPGLKTKAKEAGVVGRLGKALRSPVGEHAAELGGLGVLAVPGLDELQARARAGRGASQEAVEKKQLLGPAGHAAADVGGLGILAGPELGKLLKRRP